MRFVELDSINLGDNPRTDFDQATLKQLADSIKEVGLLQALVVAECDGDLELIDGGRRWRACKLAGLTMARCDVRPMSRADITVARLAANLQRDDLTAIDEANGYQNALKSLGITQDELAKRLGVTQGQISNRLRLLKLPDAWQQKVISHEMTATQARDLAVWAEFPGVLQEIAEAGESIDDDGEVDEEGNAINSLADLSPAAWQQTLTEAIWSASEALQGTRNIKAGWGSYDLRKVDDATKERLQVVAVKHRYGGGPVERCFNKDLWDELTAQQAGDAIAREKKHQVKQEKAAQVIEKRPPTKEELAERALHHNKRLYRHKIECLQKMIVAKAHTMTEEQLIQFALTMSLVNGRTFTREVHLRDACKTAGIKMPGAGDEWVKCGAIGRAKSTEILRGWVKNWCRQPAKSAGDTHPRWYEHVAAQLKIDFAAEWRVSGEFLRLHTLEQLGELVAEWKLIMISGGKSDQIEKILASDTPSHRIPCPKELLKVTPCGLD